MNTAQGGPLAALAQIAARHGGAWLVGGAVRDRLLGRETSDFDLAVPGDVRAFAQELGRVGDAHAFLLSEEFGAWRVRARDQSWQVDLTPLMGETLEQDLRRRDLTINAIAQGLGAGGDPRAELIDPCGGVADLEARRLRAVGPGAFAEDPLRVLRLARIVGELGFEPERGTVALASAAAAGLASVSPERVFTELRLTIVSERPAAGLELAHAVGATAVVLPELDAMRAVAQNDYHDRDVYGHTLEALDRAMAIVADPAAVFGELGPQLSRVLEEPLANELTRGQALRFGALMHDIAKPLTRGSVAGGRVTFFDHDSRGAKLVVEIMTRLRASERLMNHVAALTRHHLRLGFLVHERPLSRRAVYGYLEKCDAVGVDVTVLSVADRLATRGRNHEAATAAHVELARTMMPDALAWRASRPRPPIAGDALARALGLTPGPQLGRLLDELTAAQYAQELDGEAAVLAHAREWIARDRHQVTARS
jgi:putative nucleotidyltransferase with HDIG domain